MKHAFHIPKKAKSAMAGQDMPQHRQIRTTKIVMAHPGPARSFRPSLRPPIKQAIAVRAQPLNYSALKPDTAPCLQYMVFSYPSSPSHHCITYIFRPVAIVVVACVLFCHPFPSARLPLHHRRRNKRASSTAANPRA
jgi:hypothetical protein